MGDIKMLRASPAVGLPRSKSGAMTIEDQDYMGDIKMLRASPAVGLPRSKSGAI
jgi:hypothetical protein